MNTLYGILEVAETASPDVMAASHRALARRYHPDNRETGNETRFKEIQQAWEVLRDQKTRAQYDGWLDGERAKETAAHRERREHIPAPGAPIPAATGLDKIVVDAGSKFLRENFGHIPGVREFVKGVRKPARAAIRQHLDRATTVVAAALQPRGRS